MWIVTGFLLLKLWARQVGFLETIRGCVWVAARKTLPNRKALAQAIMPRLRTLEIQIPDHAYPFYARWPASDLHILYTIIDRKEYAPLADFLEGVKEVIFLDLGANVGAASRYMLEAFPRATVIAVEPDPGNIRLCHMNLDPYGSRVKVIQAAVWNKNTRLIFEPDSTQIGTEAGVRVREPEPGENPTASVAALDIPTLLSEAHISPDCRIAVKIDVEGSEQEIFEGPDLDWLDEVSCIAIELHDSVRPNCSKNFFAAIESRSIEPPKKISDTVFAHLNGCPRARIPR